MKILVPFAVASVLVISACGSAPQDEMTAQTPEATPPASSVHSYRCESGEVITATYPSTDSATVQYKDTNYTMQIAVSGSGARYVGENLEWWTKGSGSGSEGALYQHMTDGTSGDSIERCTEF